MHDDRTITHDLAVVYLALAYGPDHQLADRELTLITEALQAWGQDASREAVQEEVVEALAVLLQEEFDPEQLVIGALDRLADVLSHEQRQHAIEDVVRIAEADGLLLRAERTVIDAIAHRWQVKRYAQALLDATQGDRDDWTLLHDIGLIYIILAHSTDNNLSDKEIAVLVDRTRDWQPEWTEEAVRVVLRQALAYYGSNPGSEALQRSVLSIGHRLPLVQRLALVNDLFAIAEADGALLDAERAMIVSLIDAWNVGPAFHLANLPDGSAA